MVGHKLGEFSPTRVFKGHSGDKKAVSKVRNNVLKKLKTINKIDQN